MKVNPRYAAAGTAIALLTAAIPATYAVNNLISPAQARCYGIETDGDARLIDVAFLTTFLPTFVEGVPTAVNKDNLTFVMGGETYVVRHARDLEWVNPGETLEVGYIIEGGRRVATSIEFEDGDLRAMHQYRAEQRMDAELNDDV